MQQLSGLDASFLYLETADMPMHVGALQLLELPLGFKGKFVVALRKHVAQRLAEAPMLSRRLWRMPLNMANPAWVDAEPDLRQHIVEAKLPAAARQGDGLGELEAAVARLHAVPLARDRPLWKFHVFEGLGPTANGHRRVALYAQLHHAAADGQAAVALASVLLDLSPAGRGAATRRPGAEKVLRLEMREMLGGVIASQARKVAGIVRDLPATVGTIKGAAADALVRALRPGGGKAANAVSLAPRTAFNTSVGAGRGFATVSLPLAEIRLMSRAFAATVNDLVLMICATALRRYLAKRRALPRKSLVAAVPISLRPSGAGGAAAAEPLSNQVSMSLVSLGTHLADPQKRLAHIMAASASMKSTMGRLKSVLPQDFPSLGVPWLMEAAAALYGKAKLAERVPLLANLVISNLPGPALPLYLAGARLLNNYPASIVVHGLGLNITVQSYDQSLEFGLVADAQAVPELKDLADALRIAFEDLMILRRPGDPDPGAAEGPGLVRRAGRSLQGAVGGAVAQATRKVVDGAVKQAVDKMTRRRQRCGVRRPRASSATRQRRA